MTNRPAEGRLRLLVLTSTFPRWADDTEPAFVFDLCRRLAVDFEVTILAPHAPGTRRDELLAGLRVLRYRYGPAAWERLAYEGGIMANLKRRPWMLLMLPPFFLAMFWRLLRLLRELRPHAVHAHWIVPQGLVLAAALSFSGLRPRAICTVHGSDISALGGVFWRMVRRRVAMRLDVIVPVSEALRQILLLEGCPAGRTEVIPMGVDLAGRFTPAAEPVRSTGEILFVGRIAREKGADILLDAMPRILAQRPDTMLTLIGEGPEKVSLRDTAHRLGLGERVRFLGALPHTALPKHYRRATLLALPSRREGFGLVLAEALGCGCPVVASDLPAVRAMLEGGKGGRLFPPNDADGLARAVLELLSDDALRESSALRGRTLVTQRYDWPVIAHGYRRALTAAAADGRMP